MLDNSGKYQLFCLHSKTSYYIATQFDFKYYEKKLGDDIAFQSLPTHLDY